MDNLKNGTLYYIVTEFISREYDSIEELNKAVEKIKSKRKTILPTFKYRVVVKKQEVSWFELDEWRDKNLLLR